MNIIERISSLTIYFSALLLVTILIYKSKTKKNIKNILLFYVILLSIMGYLYKPYKTADLYRTFEQMRMYYENLNIEQFFGWIKNDVTIFGKIYIYIFTKIGMYNLLPAVTAFIYYSLVFKIYQNSNDISSPSNYGKTIVFLFIMACGQYIEVISGIRFMLASALISICIYMEFFYKKSFTKHIPIYIVASLIHPAILVISLVRFGFLVFQNDRKLIVKIVFIIIGILITYKYGYNYINSAFNKGISYISNDIYSYKWEYLTAIITMIYMYLTTKTLKRIDKDNYHKYINYIRLFYIIYLITTMSITTYSIFHRYRLLLSVLFIPILFLTYRKLEEEIPNKKNNFNKWTILYLLVSFIIVFTRGNLCGLNFFNN